MGKLSFSLWWIHANGYVMNAQKFDSAEFHRCSCGSYRISSSTFVFDNDEFFSRFSPYFTLGNGLSRTQSPLAFLLIGRFTAEILR